MEERIEACHATGSSMKTWCRENNLSTNQYYYWIKKLNNNFNEPTGDNLVQWAEVPLKIKLKISIRKVLLS